MAFVSKTLGQLMPGPALTTLYTVPDGAQTTASIIVCNQSVFADTYRIAVAPGGAAHEAKHYIAFDTVIPANSTETVNNIFLRAGDVVRVYASAVDVSFTAMGTEGG